MLNFLKGWCALMLLHPTCHYDEHERHLRDSSCLKYDVDAVVLVSALSDLANLTSFLFLTGPRKSIAANSRFAAGKKILTLF
jgi:hypothetical protein